MFYLLLIINKNGSLDYDKVFLGKFSSNDLLRLSATFHTMHALSNQVTPEGLKPTTKSPILGSLPEGISNIETDEFKLECFQTLTGLKFILVADPMQSDLPAYLMKTYQLYSDFVLKDPSHIADMPIRLKLFDEKVLALFNQ